MCLIFFFFQRRHASSHPCAENSAKAKNKSNKSPHFTYANATRYFNNETTRCVKNPKIYFKIHQHCFVSGKRWVKIKIGNFFFNRALCRPREDFEIMEVVVRKRNEEQGLEKERRVWKEFWMSRKQDSKDKRRLCEEENTGFDEKVARQDRGLDFLASIVWFTKQSQCKSGI